MNKVVIIPNEKKDIELCVTSAVVKKLSSLGIKSYALSKGLEGLDGVTVLDTLDSNIELVIVIGGDGSFIDASSYAVKYDIPILGVNLGKVGYLTEVDPNDLELLNGLATGEFLVQKRMLLSVISPCVNKERQRLAVNDVVFSGESLPGISSLKIEDSFGNSLKYRADGIILSTPQGSTAYSLSVGGPVLAHDVEGIVVSPVSPHSFFNRSVIFNAGESIRVTNVGEGSLRISIDGRYSDMIMSNESCTVKMSDKTLKILTFSKNSMFTNLFKKLRTMEAIN